MGDLAVYSPNTSFTYQVALIMWAARIPLEGEARVAKQQVRNASSFLLCFLPVPCS